jgi:tetratricopeptide (TPR) repeat protein
LKRNHASALALVLLAVWAAYANSFAGGFHLDDLPAVVDNPAVRSLRNMPRFFTDATASSVLPADRNYRPVVSTSLALDYALSSAFAAGKSGYAPFWFHLVTFLLFLCEVALLAALYRLLLDRIRPSDANPWLALLAAAWYGLHPAMAETVDYVSKRGDLYGTLGCVAALYLYARHPRLRPSGLYLIPFALAMLSSPQPSVVPVLLLLSVYFFEAPDEPALRRLRRAALASLPAVAATAALLWLQAEMAPKSFPPSIISPWGYRVTQPFVWSCYVAEFFLPLHLNVDTDLKPMTGLNWEAWEGILFVLVLLAAIGYTARRRGLYPIAFGLLWFVVTQVPASLNPLPEVEDDRRMFFSFAGLALAAVWGGWLLLRRLLGETSLERLRRVLVALALLVLAGYGYGVHQRNLVWHDEESLWLDDVQKSPRNGRGLMNYGLTQMAKGAYLAALEYFTRALAFIPDDSTLETNLAVVNGAIADGGDRSRAADAERHFLRAIALAPDADSPHACYGGWLYRHGRTAEAIAQLKTAVVLNPRRLIQRDLLIQAETSVGERSAARHTAEDTLREAPDDGVALQALRGLPTHEAAYWIDLSMVQYRQGEYLKCIESARKALILESDNAEAYNNIGVAYAQMQQWDDAIRNEEKAVALRPDFQLAKNNLAWARSQKAAQRQPGGARR